MQNGIRRECLKKLAFLIIFSLVFIIILLSEDFKNNPMLNGMRVTSTFGDSRGDHFHTGIDITNNDKKAYSLMESELIFHNKKRKRGIDYGYGEFVILENTTDGLRFTYSHLKEDSYDASKKQYEQYEKIATIGNTGHSTGVHLHLEVEDTINDKLLNPLEIMDIKDTLKPIIMDVYFIDGDKNRISLYEGYSSIKRGGKLFIQCMDKIDGSNYPLTPYKISLIIDGKEKANLKFNNLLKQNGKFITNDGRTFNNIYLNERDDDFFVLDFTSLPGVIGFKVLVEDQKGNRTEYKRALRILLPDKKENEEEEEAKKD